MSTQPSAKSTSRVLLAGIIGNVMEWYDFALYGYFATTIGREFFPSSDPASSLIGAFGAFAAGFLVRPLGGMVFGRIGDLAGRQRALQLSVMVMAVPTVLMAYSRRISRSASPLRLQLSCFALFKACQWGANTPAQSFF